MAEWIAGPLRLSHAGEVLIAASMLLCILIAVTRRLPVIAGLGLVAGAMTYDLWLKLPGCWRDEAATLAAGGLPLLLVTVAPGVWLFLRASYWLPERLSDSTESEDLLKRTCSSARMESVSAFRALGFEPVGLLYLEGGLERQVREYFVDPSGTIIGRMLLAGLGYRGMSFSTEQDGARIVTTNWPFLSPFPVPAATTIYYHCYCTPKELLRKHRQHLATRAMDDPIVRRGEEVLQSQKRGYQEEAERLVQIGRLRPDRRGRLRMTLKALYAYMAWGLFLDFRHKNFRMGG